MANLHDVGDLVRVTGTFTDADGNAQDPTVVKCDYTDPSGNTTELVYGTDEELVKSSTGVYYTDINADEAGLWTYRWYSTGTGQAADEGWFQVEEQRTAETSYISLLELKARLNISGTGEDAELARIIERVSRSIDAEAGDRFYTTSSDETRYFTAKFPDLLMVGSIVSITSLATDRDGDRTYETTWTTDDYDLEPFNAAAKDYPYTRVRVTPN